MIGVWQFQRKREIDPAAKNADSAIVLPDSNTALEGPKTGRAGSGKRWIWLGALLLGLIWLDGPGFRWMAPRVGSHLMSWASLRGGFQIEGRLSCGFSITQVRVDGGNGMASVRIDRLTPVYRLGGLVRGRLTALTVDGLHVDLKLGERGAGWPWPEPKQWIGSLQRARGRVIPLDLDFNNLTLEVSRDGEPMFQLAPSRLRHRADDDNFFIEFGVVTDAARREWPAQRETVRWEADQWSLPRLDPLPGVALRNGVLHLPPGGVPSFEVDLRLDDAVFHAASTSGFSSLRVDLCSGKLNLGEIGKRFGYEVPAAKLSSFSLELADVSPDLKAATGEVHLLLEEGEWKEWRMPRLALDAKLRRDECSLAARGTILGGEVVVDATAAVARELAGLQLGDARGQIGILDAPRMLSELAQHTSRIDAMALVPPSTAAGRFQASFHQNRLSAVSAEWVLKPQDGELASDIAFKTRWEKDQSISADLTLDGLTSAATYQPDSASYQAAVEFKEFNSHRIDRWLAIVKMKPVGAVTLTGKWTGGGELRAGRHRGDFSLVQGAWSRGAAPLTAAGVVHYDWPTSLTTKGLQLGMDGQMLSLEAALADSQLDISDFLWCEGGRELATGRAHLPLPKDFANWRAVLVDDVRPIAVDCQSRVLPLSLLQPWFPALVKLDPHVSGQFELRVAGTYSQPTVKAKLEAKELRALVKSSLPPADLKVTLASDGGRMVLEGIATSPNLPPAVMSAAMPFHPAAWVQNRQLLEAEAIDGRVDLPRLDLSRYAALLPAAEKVSGIVTGNLVLAGTFGKPTVAGAIELTRGGLRLKNQAVPAIEDVAVSVDFTRERVVLKSLTGSVAGGRMQGGGTLAVADGKFGEVDLRFRGDHLLLRRDDLLILRASADLRLQGLWQQAKLSGTVGAVDSIFYRDIELLPIGMPFTTPQAAALPKIDTPRIPVGALGEPYRNWGLDLRVRSETPLLIRGNFATGQIDGLVHLGGSLGNPLPVGSVSLKNFRAALPFSTLSVRSGTATFSPATGFDPILEIRGTAEPRPYQVAVYAYGRASNPELVLTSNPPLPDREIMTLLATGTTSTGLENPQAASSRALQLLVEEMRRGRFRLGKRLRPLLALLDRVDFTVAEADPYSSESFSTATLSITDRWFLAAGMGATGDSRMLAIWRLSFR